MGLVRHVRVPLKTGLPPRKSGRDPGMRNWRCPKCGARSLADHPTRCWKCGTSMVKD